jgi:DNA-binding transcriptional regulator YiaG
MKRCARCESRGPVVEKVVEATREVAGRVYVGFLPGSACVSCHAVFHEAHVVERFELHVASTIAASGLTHGAAFRFMRKSLGMRAVELAALLDVAPETISRWETARRAVDRGALVVLGALVRDALEGRTDTIDNLRALQTPRPLARTVRIDVAHSLEKAVGA